MLETSLFVAGIAALGMLSPGGFFTVIKTPPAIRGWPP